MLQSIATPAPCQAHLETRAQDGLLTVTGHCRNLRATAERYRYELSLQRTSHGSHSQNTQGGEFAAPPQQDVSLSQTQVNIDAEASYHIHLRVFDLAGHILAQDSVIQVPTR